MTNFTKSAFGILLALGTVASTSSIASAQYYEDYGRGPPPRFEAERDWSRPPPPRPGWDRPPRGVCDPRWAEDKARDFGFRRARVVDVTPRRVIVQGWTRRGPDEISFANVRGCPTLR